MLGGYHHLDARQALGAHPMASRPGAVPGAWPQPMPGVVFHPAPCDRGDVATRPSPIVVLIALLAGVVLVLGGMYGARKAKEMSLAPPPKWILDLVEEAGDAHSNDRGVRGTPQRALVEALYAGTHVEGYPAGRPRGDLFILQHAGEQIPGEYGEVVLSEAAAQLRAAFIERGFRHRRLFHGTENPFIPSILSGGFMTTDGALGTGIYLAETFAHAQCYAPGEGEPILEVDAYWHPSNESRYINHVPHRSLANDVFLVKDPLLVFPVKVDKCCPQELNCMR